jgi:signal transduction histidine kinase
METVRSDILDQVNLLLLAEDLLQAIPTQIQTWLDLKNVSLFYRPKDDVALLTDSLISRSVTLPANDPAVIAWQAGHPFSSPGHTDDNPTLLQHIDYAFTSLPLISETTFIGALIVDFDIDEATVHKLKVYSASITALLHRHRQQEAITRQLSDNLTQIEIFNRIDQELTETIRLERVFEMMLDWALRFTNAMTASIALVKDDGTLRIMQNYGFSISDDDVAQRQAQYTNTITHRAVRSGKIERLPNVKKDDDSGWVPVNIKAQLAAPIIREERTVAVITLGSPHLNGFGDEHVRFMRQLADRAAYAIDNARLYAKTESERQRLSTIIDNVADVVIVVDQNSRIELIGQSALNALQLYPNQDYSGEKFQQTITFKPLERLYERALRFDEVQQESMRMPNRRDYSVRVMPLKSVGKVILMQDITPFKEMDDLKNDLIATVSHDLKQPLSAIRGFVELLRLKNKFNDESRDFCTRLENSIDNMQQLIDDQLDLARIQSGNDLEITHLDLHMILNECVNNHRPQASKKHMTLRYAPPSTNQRIRGDETRIKQIFNNLINNAVKYTPPEGEINIEVENRGSVVRVTIRDTGLGIGPEDQSRVFERFYRVRRPETESIEGTGLGLAIVKKLVEAHSGKIRLESKLGEGTTFFVTLPVLVTV